MKIKWINKDFVLVAIDQTYENELKYKSLNLILPEVEKSARDTDGTISHNQNKAIRIHGEVIMTPNTLSASLVDSEGLHDAELSNVSIGDRVYYYYSQIVSQEPLFKTEDGRDVYKIRWDSLICVVSKETKLVKALAGHAILTDGKLATQSKSGLILLLEEEPLTYKVEVLYGYFETKKGDRVLIKEHNNWVMTIEGIICVPCKEYNILGKFIS